MDNQEQETQGKPRMDKRGKWALLILALFVGGLGLALFGKDLWKWASATYSVATAEVEKKSDEKSKDDKPKTDVVVAVATPPAEVKVETGTKTKDTDKTSTRTTKSKEEEKTIKPEAESFRGNEVVASTRSEEDDSIAEPAPARNRGEGINTLGRSPSGFGNGVDQNKCLRDASLTVKFQIEFESITYSYLGVEESVAKPKDHFNIGCVVPGATLYFNARFSDDNLVEEGNPDLTREVEAVYRVDGTVSDNLRVLVAKQSSKDSPMASVTFPK
jgi:hypothetical protein